jgi:dipeptide/tripeptide permease
MWLLTIALSGLVSRRPTLDADAGCQLEEDRRHGLRHSEFWRQCGGILAPIVTGFIAHTTGSFALALGLCGVILIIGALAYWFLVDERVEVAE